MSVEAQPPHADHLLAASWRAALEAGEQAACSAAATRSYTALAAADRLGLLSQDPAPQLLRLHVVGAQPHVEGDSVAAVERSFGSLCGLLAERGVAALALTLSGPDAHGSSGSRELASGLLLSVCFLPGLLHERDEPPPATDLALLYNAGLWGYDSWAPTLRALAASGAPSVASVLAARALGRGRALASSSAPCASF